MLHYLQNYRRVAKKPPSTPIVNEEQAVNVINDEQQIEESINSELLPRKRRRHDLRPGVYVPDIPCTTHLEVPPRSAEKQPMEITDLQPTEQIIEGIIEKVDE